MDNLDYWRLCDELTVVQAALLIADEDPSSSQSYVEGWDPENRPVGYEAAKAAISNALLRDAIVGNIVPESEYDTNGNPYGSIDGTIVISLSTVEVKSLRDWLFKRGFKSGFFFPDNFDSPDYLDPDHSRYAPKLAAAVTAWLAVDDEESTKGMTAKQALVKWLREHAAKYKLSDSEGKPNETGIEECAKVANWQEKGGAPKTPN
jgi:hypothetical protein